MGTLLEMAPRLSAWFLPNFNPHKWGAHTNNARLFYGYNENY